MFVVSFANFKSCALCYEPSGDHMMPCAEVHIRAQGSYKNITVLSHLKLYYLFLTELLLPSPHCNLNTCGGLANVKQLLYIHICLYLLKPSHII